MSVERLDDIRRIVEAAGKLGPSSAEPPDEVRQALFEQVARERAAAERLDGLGRRWSAFALAASVLLLAAVGLSGERAAAPVDAWRVLGAGAAGMHQRLAGGGGLGGAAIEAAGDGWMADAMRRSGLQGVQPPEFNLSRAGWKAQSALPLPGGGLAVHMRRGDQLITAAMVKAGPDDAPPGGVVRQHGAYTLRSFERDGLAWVYWHEGSVLCVLTGRVAVDDLARIVVSGFPPA